MGHWNHRLFKKTFDNGEVEYTVREVFYNDDGTIHANMVDGVELACESIEGLREYIGWCLKALDEPMLVDGEVEYVDYNDYDDPDQWIEVTNIEVDDDGQIHID